MRAESCMILQELGVGLLPILLPAFILSDRKEFEVLTELQLKRVLASKACQLGAVKLWLICVEQISEHDMLHDKG